MPNTREKLIELISDCIDPKERLVLDGAIRRMADHLVANGVTMQEWISVKDRLPSNNDRVIAFRSNEPETSAYKYCVMWGWSLRISLKHSGITHWCNLPQTPKGD